MDGILNFLVFSQRRINSIVPTHNISMLSSNTRQEEPVDAVFPADYSRVGVSWGNGNLKISFFWFGKPHYALAWQNLNGQPRVIAKRILKEAVKISLLIDSPVKTYFCVLRLFGKLSECYRVHCQKQKKQYYEGNINPHHPWQEKLERCFI